MLELSSKSDLLPASLAQLITALLNLPLIIELTLCSCPTSKSLYKFGLNHQRLDSRPVSSFDTKCSLDMFLYAAALSPVDGVLPHSSSIYFDI